MLRGLDPVSAELALETRERRSWKTLIEAFKHTATEGPQRGVYVHSRSGAQEFRSWAQILEGALRVGAALEQKGLEHGDQLLIVMPTSFEFLTSFFGAMLIGVTPVPLAPPRADHPTPLKIVGAMNRISERLNSKHILFDRSLPIAARPNSGPSSPFKKVLELEEILSGVPAGAAAWPRVKLPEIAYIQPTSGTAGKIKGVALSHANILSNIRAVGHAVQINADDIGVSWLPLDNIMGLVGFVLFSAYWGLDLVLMDPERFLQHPHEWLWAIHRHRGTITAAPDFAYYHTVRRVNERDLSGLELSSLRVAMSGAEPVRARHMKMFTKRYAPYGLGAHVFMPVYGLSEATLGVTFSGVGQRVAVDALNRKQLELKGEAEPLPSHDEHSPYERMHLVCVGKPLMGTALKIVDAAGVEVGERVLGEVVVSGPHVASRYVSPDELDFLEDGWLKTGDLGYIAQGQLYIVERKDSAIQDRWGRRLFPNEIELFVNSVDGVRAGTAVAFMVGKDHDEKLVIAYETQAGVAHEELEREIERLLKTHLDLEPKVLLALSTMSIPKTRDGKVCRHIAQRLYLEGRLDRREREGELDGMVRLFNRARSDVLRLTHVARAKVGQLLNKPK